ncbi:MAG TPA: hypothetical protein VMU88_09280 [bacterium]|nr:hypothetical protein [bacterium]
MKPFWNSPRALAWGALLALWGALPLGATEKEWPKSFQDHWDLGIVLGDPEGWGITSQFWLDQDCSLQPAVKFGWSGNPALQCDLLWHNDRWIPARHGTWPVYGGLGAVADAAGPAYGFRAVLGVSNRLEDLPGDFFVQLVPTYWVTGPGAAWQLYGELGLRLSL